MIFLESPWPILLLGVAVEAALAVALLRTGRGWLLWAMIGMGAFTLAGLVVERLVVTDEEAVSDALDACAAAVEANDLNRLLEWVSPRATKARNEARWLLDRVEVRKVRISELKITLNRLTSPPMAKATFYALGTGRDRHGEFPYNTFGNRVTVELRREGDLWRVAGYTVEGLDRP